jgi:3-oxoacyl-[acyl-carrier protein] reductase
MSDPAFDDKVVVITGAAGTMGEAAARWFGARGARVAMVDVSEARLLSLEQGMAGRARGFRCDIRSLDEVRDTHERVVSAWGQVDILVNNAGVLSNHKVEATTLEEWRQVLSVNLDGALFWSQCVVPGMKTRRWGRIVNVGSLAAKTGGLTAGTAYSVTKGAISALTFSLARELAPFGVTANAIAPAYVKTPMVTEQLNEAQRQALLQQIPVGRFCEPEEFAHAVGFLASPLSGFITGEVLDLNGGLHMD